MAKSDIDVNVPVVPDGLDQRTTEGEKIALSCYTSAVTGINASGKLVKVAVVDLTINPDNPREEYDVEGMISSYRHRGFVIGQPITVSKRSAVGDKPAVLMVLRGNRRVSAAQALATRDPAAFKAIFPDGKIPCLVLTDLTRAEEITALIDHGKEQDRRKLSAREELRAIRQLMKAGIKGRDAIARALDLTTVSVDDKGIRTEKIRSSYIQPRLNLLALPVALQERFIAESSMFGGKNRNLRQEVIAPLYTALSNDRKAGNIGADGFGPELRTAWDGLLNKPTNAPADAPVRLIAESKNKVLLQECDSRTATNMLNFLGGNSKELKLADIDSACQALEAAQATLADISTLLGPVEFASLCERALEAGQAKREAAKAIVQPEISEDAPADAPAEATV